MKDFIFASLPWIVIGITIAVITAFLTKSKKRNDIDLKTQSDEDKKEEETYISQGISLGMCFGVAIGSALMNIFGDQALTYGICFGMLTGLLIGMNIKKK